MKTEMEWKSQERNGAKTVAVNKKFVPKYRPCFERILIVFTPYLPPVVNVVPKQFLCRCYTVLLHAVACARRAGDGYHGSYSCNSLQASSSYLLSAVSP